MRPLPLVLAAALFGCKPLPPPPSPAPTPPPDLDGGAPSCATWCDRARELHCSAGRPTPAGASCEDVCANMQDGPAPFDVACRTFAATCADADGCESQAFLGASARPTCSAWCKHATELRCDAARRTPAGASCVDVCLNVQSGPAPFDLRCRIAARNCGLADRCERP